MTAKRRVMMSKRDLCLSGRVGGKHLAEHGKINVLVCPVPGMQRSQSSNRPVRK